MNKTRLSKNQIISIISAVFVFLAHIAVLVGVLLAYRYFGIYPSLFAEIVGIVICFLLIIDAIYFVGFKHKDIAMKVTSLVLALFITLGGSVGIYFINRVNGAIDSVIDISPAHKDTYETISGVFVCNKTNASKYNDLKDIAGAKVGIIKESTEGVASVGQSILKEANIDTGLIEYEDDDTLLSAVHDGKVDVAIFLNGYRGIFDRDENADYSGILNDLVDFYEFDKEVKIDSLVSYKDISTDPFNILLIGWSRTELGSSIGLADAIIVASVNPKTYTVSMMSIARDSYVPIACYGGTKDKINSGRSTSRACFIETVENFTGMKMDFYMEADYEAIIAVVNELGGIEITNPVSFELDGVYVPEGTYVAWGTQVLEFCRERHHMPNGDFDRQQHQKEVIIAIAQKLLKSRDISLFLNAIEVAGEKFSTNLTLNQLTGMFNMLLNTKNYTGLKAFDLVDFHQLRITGYGSWYYNYSMNLPLWIYKVYQGSVDESISHAKEVLGLTNNVNSQVYSFSFDVSNPYNRPLFYSLDYNEAEVHEEMPLYYPNLTNMTFEEASAWAKENGVTLNVTFITEKDDEFNQELAGYVMSQSVRYGMLVKDYPSVNLVVMGGGKGAIPNFEGMTVEEFKEWAKENEFKKYELIPVTEGANDANANKIISQSVSKGTPISTIENLKLEYYEYKTVDLTGIKLGMTKANLEAWVAKNLTKTPTYTTAYSDSVAKNCLISYTPEKGSSATAFTFVISKGADPEKCSHVWDSGTITKEATCKEEGVKSYSCTKCEKTKTEKISKIDHNYVLKVDTAATCETDGVGHYECSMCGETKTGSENTVIEKLGHDWTEWSNNTATCTEGGKETRECERCHNVQTQDTGPLGHDFGEDNEYEKCSRCEADNPDYQEPSPQTEPGTD